MAEQQEQILINVKLDKAQAQKNVVDLEKDLLGLRQQQKDLNKALKDGTISQEEYAQKIVAVKGAIKDKSAEQREAVKINKAEDGSLNALKARLAQLAKQRNSTNQSTEAGVIAAKKLDKQMNELTNRIKQNEEASGNFTRSVGRYKDSILEAAKAQNIFGVNVGKATGLMGAATGSIQGGTKALQLFKVALISTGIGALLVALGSLVTYFTKTQRGADQVNKVLKTIGATVDVVADRMSQFGEGIVNFLSGDWQAARDNFRNATVGVLEEIQTESAKAYKLEERRQQLERDQIKFLTREAQLRNEIEQLRSEGIDKSNSAAKREEALSKAIKLQNELTGERIKLQEREVAILSETQDLGENMIEDDRARAEAQARLIDIRANAAREQRRVISQLNSARQEAGKEALAFEEEAERKAAEKRLQIRKEEQAEIKRIKSEGIEKEQAMTNPADDMEVKYANQVVDLKIMSQKRLQETTRAIAEAQLLYEQQLQQQRLAVIADAAGVAASFFEEQTVAHKLFASAQASINSFLAFTEALANSVIPFPFRQINAAMALASGLATVAKINNVQFAEGGVLPDERGGVVRGRSHAMGGVHFASGGVNTEVEGNEIILTKGVYQDPQLREIASRLNVAGGGRHFYAEGGVLGQNIAQRNITQSSTGVQFQRAMNNLPPIYVAVTEINEKQGQHANVVYKSTI